MSNDLYRYFGLRKGNPFLAAPRYDWRGLRFVVNRLRDTAREVGWRLIYAPPAAGKTVALRAFIERFQDEFWIVQVHSLSRRTMRMKSLYDALYEDLNIAEYEKREYSRECRPRQLRRIGAIREAVKPILIILDDANLFSDDLLDGLKVLRDLRFNKRQPPHDQRDLPHFAIAMFGWAALARRIAAREQYERRVDIGEVKPMSLSELAGFIDHVGLRRIVPEAAQQAIFLRERYPGIVERRVLIGMERAASAGRKVLLPEDITGQAQVSDVAKLKSELERRGISQREIARATGRGPHDGCAISPTTVNTVLNDSFKGKPNTRVRVLAACQRLIEDDQADQGALKPSRRLSA